MTINAFLQGGGGSDKAIVRQVNKNTNDINVIKNATGTTIQNISQVNKAATTTTAATSEQFTVPLDTSIETDKLVFFKNRYDIINIKLMALETNTINSGGGEGNLDITCVYVSDPKLFFWSRLGIDGLISNDNSIPFTSPSMNVAIKCDLADNGISIRFTNTSTQSDYYMHYTAIITNIGMDTTEPDF